MSECAVVVVALHDAGICLSWDLERAGRQFRGGSAGVFILQLHTVSAPYAAALLTQLNHKPPQHVGTVLTQKQHLAFKAFCGSQATVVFTAGS